MSSYLEARVIRSNPAMSIPNGSAANGGSVPHNSHPHSTTTSNTAGFSPIFGRSTSGSSVTTSSSPSESPQNSPSPSQNSLLNTSAQELFEVGSFNTDISVYDQSDHSGYSKTCNYVSGVKLKTPAEFGRNDHSAVLYEDSMYIYGGVSMDNTLPTTIQILNFATKSFVTISPIGTSPRYQHATIVSDGNMIVFGGGAENMLLNDLVSFSFETQTWSEIVPRTAVRPAARRGHTMTLIGKSLFVFGGFGGPAEGAPLNDIYKFDLEQKSWTQVQATGAVPQPRFLHSCCPYPSQNAFYVFGGTNVEYVFGDLFTFNCDTNIWEEVAVSDPPNPLPRCSHAAVVSQDSMYIIGGATDSEVLDAHEFYFESKKWYRLELTTQGAPRQGHSAVLRGESIFLFGGITGPNHNQLDLLSLGTKDEFEDEESAQIFSQAIPRSMWEAILLKKHPEILQYRELTRNLTGVRTYARSRQSATTEDPAHLNHQLILNLIVEYLHAIGCSRTASAITEESKVPYFPLTAQPDSRLVMILKVLKSRTKPRNIFDAEFSVTNARVPDPVDAEVELVDHMAGAGRVDAQLDGEEDVDIWAEPDDSRKNILRIKDDNGKSVIKAANLNKLVQVLTLDREKAPDAVYLKTFFYTYQSFTSPETLLKKLIQKYHVRPEKGVIVDDRYKTEVVEPVQTRVCRVLKFWIEQCPWDFNGPAAEKLLNNLNAFIDGPLSRDNNFNLVKQLRNSITKSLKKKPNAEEEKTITAGFNPPDPKVPRKIFSHSLSLKDVDELEIARQLTLFEFKLFSSITPPEFLNKAWEDPNPKKAIHLKAIMSRSVDVARWVAYTILKADDKKARSRSKMLEKFIKVADQLRQLKNFQTAKSVISGFTHSSIIRLNQTFSEISPRAKEIYQELVSFSRDDKPYREIMRNPPLPCIPNIDLTLGDLSALHDTTPDLLNNLVNFQKRQLIYLHITRFQGFQQRQFNLLPVHQIAALVSKLPKTTDKELEEQSRKWE